jgi:ATP-binding cassette subfamily C protein CydC
MSALTTDARAVLRLAQPSARQFAPGLILAVFAGLAAVGLLATAAWLITRASDMPPIMYLNVAIVGVRFFALARAGFRYAERLTSHDAAFRSLALLRVGIYRRLVPLAPDGLKGTRRGDLLSRLVADVDQLQDLPLRVISPALTALVVAAVSVTTVWIILPLAGLTLLVALAVAGVAGTYAQSRISAVADHAIAPRRAALDDAVMDTLGRMDVLTAFSALDTRISGIEKADASLRLAQQRRALGSGVVAAVVSLAAGAATAAALYFGTPELVFVPNANEIPGLGWGIFSGPYLAVVVLVPIAVFEVFQLLPQALSAWRGVRTSAERVAAVVPKDIPREIPVDSNIDVDIDVESNSGSGKVSATLNGGSFTSLSVSNVSASWPAVTVPNESAAIPIPALAPVSFTVVPGDRLLVTGPSGTGKTTLAHLLVRFLESSGTYSINGIDVRTVGLDDVRHVVGLVEQSPHLFDDTIRQNLLFARPEASEAELMRVLERVGLARWVAERGGLDSAVGERGGLVSGGQAQRLALARALLHNFPVLILDEPTANVDPGFADELVRDILSAASDEHRAIILISHVPVDPDLVTHKLILF